MSEKYAIPYFQLKLEELLLFWEPDCSADGHVVVIDPTKGRNAEMLVIFLVAKASKK